MKKQKIVLLFLGMALICICMAGCEKSERYEMAKASKDDMFPIYEQDDEDLQEVSELQTLQDVYKSGYEFEEWQLKDIKEPGDILVLEDAFVVSDRQADCVFKIDHSGNVIAQMGQTGNGDGEFLKPSALAAYNNEIYVLDQGNNRIQVLDEDLAYNREIKLKDTKTEDPNYFPQNIAVNGEGVFVTGLSLENPVVDRYAEGMDEAVSNFIGSIDVYEGQVYCINSMVRYYDEENDSFGAVTAAPGWLVSVKEGEVGKLCEMPYGFNITAFLVDKKGILCVSGSGGAVYRLNEDGVYEETIFSLPELQDEETPQIEADDKENIYIVMPKAKKIYRCYK